MIHERKNPFLYTKSGELSLGPLTLIICCLLGMLAFMLEGFGVMQHISIAAWTWFGSFTTLCFIAGAAVDRARLIAKGKVDETVAASDASTQTVPTPDKPVVDDTSTDILKSHGANIEHLDSGQ